MYTTAAAAKSLQSCPTLCDPIDGSPPGSPVLGTLTHIYGIEKDGNDNPVCDTAKETQMYRNLLDSVGVGEGGMIWENGTET